MNKKKGGHSEVPPFLRRCARNTLSPESASSAASQLRQHFRNALQTAADTVQCSCSAKWPGVRRAEQDNSQLADYRDVVGLPPKIAGSGHGLPLTQVLAPTNLWVNPRRTAVHLTVWDRVELDLSEVNDPVRRPGGPQPLLCSDPAAVLRAARPGRRPGPTQSDLVSHNPAQFPQPCVHGSPICAKQPTWWQRQIPGCWV